MGYARVKKPRGCQTLQDISQYLAGTWPHVTSAILVTHIQGAPVSSRRFQLLLPEKNPDGGKRFVLHDTMDRGRFSCVSTLYLPAAEAGLQVSPPKCPSSIDVPRSLPQNHFGYRFFQPNPRNNFIGDCVIRAYAAVLDVDWGTALRRLAQSCDLNLTWLNLVDVDQYLLSELKCTHHEALRTDGHLLKGVDFCAYSHQGDRKRGRYLEPSSAFIRHTIAVSECYVQIMEICRMSPSLRIGKLHVEPECWRSYQKDGKTVSLRAHAERSRAKFGKLLCLDCIKQQ